MNLKPRKNLYFIFYTERIKNFWIIPSQDIVKLGKTNKSGKNEGRVSISFPKLNQGEIFNRSSKYLNENGFNILKKKSRRFISVFPH